MDEAEVAGIKHMAPIFQQSGIRLMLSGTASGCITSTALPEGYLTASIKINNVHTF